MNPYYQQYIEAIAQRNADAAVLLILCAVAALTWWASARMGKVIHYVYTGLLAAAYLTLFGQGIMEVLK